MAAAQRGARGTAPRLPSPESHHASHVGHHPASPTGARDAAQCTSRPHLGEYWPEDARATVGDGLRHVLKRSGYGLCQTAHAVIELYALPLPAAHLHLGPMTLRDALLTLAGPAWELHADDRARQICFERPGDRAVAESPSEPPATEAVQTFPLAPMVSGGQP